MLPKKIFFCYAHEDEPLLNKLKTHLSPLQRQGFISTWYDQDISAGTEWEQEINQHLNAAEIILLLISADFMNSDYCYGIEMQQAIERHKRGEAKVIPVILRRVHWGGAPFSKLQVLPTGAKPVTEWDNPDKAFLNITEGIRRSIGMQKASAVSTSSLILPREPHSLPVQSVQPSNTSISQQQIFQPLTKSSKTRKPTAAETIIFFNVIFVGIIIMLFVIFRFSWLTDTITVILFILDFLMIIGLIADPPNPRN